MISGYFILEWLVYILVILLLLECIIESTDEVESRVEAQHI